MPQSLVEARSDHQTEIAKEVKDAIPMGEPASELFTLVHYSGDTGELAAWISKPPAESEEKLPAMIWVTGGLPPGGIDKDAWTPIDQSNDQSAKCYREAGMIMMYPTFRGCVGNPGVQEGFYGEVDDVIAAAEHLQALDHIDPNRIYLGGHSTGGTLVLLVAEATDLFAGIVCFGPVEDPFYYGPETVFHKDSYKERDLRAPIHYLNSIKTPVLIIEGSKGNIQSLFALKRASGGKNDKLTFVEARDRGHFDVLGPANKAIAERLMSSGELMLRASDL